MIAGQNSYCDAGWEYVTYARIMTDIPSRIRASQVKMNSGVLEQSRPAVPEAIRSETWSLRRKRAAVAREYVLSSR